MVTAQSLLQDVDGALRADQHEVAACAGRVLVLECLGIKGISNGGEQIWPPGGVAFDCFANIAEADRADALALMDRGARVDSAAAGQAWLAELTTLVSDLEASLDIAGKLPVLRTPEGMFGAMRMTRGAFEVAASMDLVPIFPDAWTMDLPPTS